MAIPSDCRIETDLLQFRVSSMGDPNHGVSQARLTGTGWIPDPDDQNPYIKADIGSTKQRIHGIVYAGRTDKAEDFVTSFELSICTSTKYSFCDANLRKWTPLGKTFQGATKNTQRVSHFFSMWGIPARAVMFSPKTWAAGANPGVRIGFIICPNIQMPSSLANTALDFDCKTTGEQLNCPNGCLIKCPSNTDCTDTDQFLPVFGLGTYADFSMVCAAAWQMGGEDFGKGIFKIYTQDAGQTKPNFVNARLNNMISLQLPFESRAFCFSAPECGRDPGPMIFN